jgi:hypothetical protein
MGASLLLLDDHEEQLRRLALYTIPRQFDVDIARRLRTIISRDAFDGWDYGDKRRAFLAYAAAAGKRATRELTEVLVTRTMFSDSALDDRRCAAAFAIASLGDETLMPTLEAEQKRMFGGKRVKEACESAMSLLKFKKSAEEPAPQLRVTSILDEARALDTSHLPKPIWDLDAPPGAQKSIAPAMGGPVSKRPPAGPMSRRSP